MTTSQIATPKGAIMARKSKNIAVTIIASSAEEGLALFQSRVANIAKLDGVFSSVTAGEPKSAKHGLYTVDVTVAADADADQVWFWLTSYGMSPSKALGSKLGAACERMADAQA